MPHTHVEVSQTGFQGLPHDDYDHVKIHRLNENIPTDKSHYLMAVLFEVHVGEPCLVHYPGPTVIYVIDGDFQVEEQSNPGNVSKLAAGDVIHLDEGSHYTWSSSSKGAGFAVARLPSHLRVENMVLKN